MAEKISRNAPCPCGSGQKYKRCCLNKNFEWVQEDDGHLYREMPLSESSLAALEQLRDDFRARNNRDPEPGERVFSQFNSPEELQSAMLRSMEASGIEPALLYAFDVTGGLMVTDVNESMIPDVDLEAFEQAIFEYEIQTGTVAKNRRFSLNDMMALMQRPPQQE